MSFLLPATTLVLVVLGALCLFMAMEHDRRTQAIRSRQTAGRPALAAGIEVQSSTQTQKS